MTMPDDARRAPGRIAPERIARAPIAWWRRFTIAVAAGIAVGAIVGWASLRQLTGPSAPRPTAVTDTPPETTTAAPRRVIRGPRADGMRSGADGEAMVGSGRLASRDSVAIVPDLRDRVEGDARRLLQSAGFTVGAIVFRVADRPEGTVLESDPVAGTRLSLPAEVRLTLATRQRDRPFTDSLWNDQRADSLPSDTMTLSRLFR